MTGQDTQVYYKLHVGARQMSQLRNVCTTAPILEKKISTTKHVFVMTFITLVLFGIKFRTERCVTHLHF